MDFYNTHQVTNSINDTNWIHWTLTYDSASLNRVIYKDGLKKYTSSVNVKGATSRRYIGSLNLQIGAVRFSGLPRGDFFKGYLDDIKIFDFALDTAQVYDNFCRSYITDTITSCGPYTWTDGKTYTTSNNTAKDTFINAAGCDSMVSLNLTILQLPTITGSSSVCISDTIILTATSPIGTVDIFPPWVSSNVNVATVVDGVVKGISEGSTVLTFYAPNGCSVSQIITVLPSSYDTLTFLECDSVISPTGKVYTSTGSYNDTLVNSFGCDSVITSLVTIGDTISPTALTQNLTLYLNQLGQVSTSSSDVNNGSSDNCGITSYRLSDSIFDCTDVGTNTIYLIVTDRYGNIDSASAVVTVQDTIKPTVLTQNVTVSLRCQWSRFSNRSRHR